MYDETDDDEDDDSDDESLKSKYETLRGSYNELCEYFLFFLFLQKYLTIFIFLPVIKAQTYKEQIIAVKKRLKVVYESAKIFQDIFPSKKEESVQIKKIKKKT